jgi:ubiquinone biosynthesis protein Coq4
MHNSPAYDESFVQLLLEKSDSQFCEISRLKSHIKELKEPDEKKSWYEKTITELQEKNLLLKSRVEYLRRRLRGKSSEHFIKEDPLQRRIDFEGMEQLPEEAQEAEKAVQEIETYRTKVIRERVKAKPSRHALPENLPRIEEHLYPEVENRDALRELPPEITEVPEFTPGRLYVRKIIRHKYVPDTQKEDNTSPTVTAGMPVLPLCRSYAASSLQAELMINK